MKKITTTQTTLIAIVALVVGFLIGFSIKSNVPSTDELAGSIGKVDRFRNVQITEEDIMLRNELVEDTAKRTQYEKYLLFNYYQALKTSSDVERVLAIATAEIDFDKVYYPYSNALTNFKAYLESARADILSALNLILTIDQNQDVPVVDYLNKAQNAIARIRNHDQVLMNYMTAMATYIETHPDGSNDALIDAHDILALNVMHSAVLTQNKPVLTYLEKKKLMNEKDGMTELVAEASMKSALQNQFLNDVENLNAIASENLLQGVEIASMENLQGFVINNIEAINSMFNSSFLNSVSELGNQPLLFDLINSSENIQGIEQLSNIESIGFRF
ncbi:MAG: hypothetical protein KG029_12625 [Bacteroidetes bacterium]|jgi:hypothetical protein|nr:hypothetical protein [Bacteroidota bacterium]